MVEIIREICDWKLVKNICRMTEGKEYTDKEPSREFIQKVIISEHSPIRMCEIFIRFREIPSWVSVHFVRHNHSLPFVSTQRTDRTGTDRRKLPQDNPVREEINYNAQSLIDVARKRLCYKASPETRMQMEELKEKIRETQPELAKCMVPNCIYRCGCPEFESCGYFKAYVQWAGTNKDDILTVLDRYNSYDDWIRRPTRLGEEK